ncbi:hypothetical protein ACKVWM_009189 [Pyricularia oryzae]
MASGFGTSRIRRSKTHVVPFQDHAGQPALSTFNADESCPLPYLYSYCIYFTHPNVRPDVPHSADAVRRLYETIVIENAPFNPCDCLFRLDMYFLPNGNRDECMRHYRAERDARGSYMVQVEAVESGAAQPTAETARMPGLVPSYARQDMSRHSYHALIYVCDAPDWRGGEDETITRLEFEPLSQGDYERFNKDAEDQHEPDMLPETAAVLETIGKNSPGFGKPTPAMPRQSRLDGRFTEMWYMADHMFDRAPRQRMGEDAWQEARERGWTSCPVKMRMERMDIDIVFTGLGTFRIPILVKDVTSDLTTFHSRLSLRNNPTQYAYPPESSTKVSAHGRVPFES